MWASILLLIFPTSQSFLMMGSNCICPQTASCPQPYSCPEYRPNVVSHGVKTMTAAPLPDELDLRAVAFGIPFAQEGRVLSNIQQFEKLVEQHGNTNSGQLKTPVESTFEYKEEDADLFGGLKREVDIRRAPKVSVSHQENSESTVVAAESKEQEDNDESNNSHHETKCNSQILKELMLNNMSDNSSESKRKINRAAEAKFGGSVDVICSRGHFSYVFSSNLYCEATKRLVTCIAFRQAT